ncbi:uncharacterized protein LOC127093902 [Lathyrus oleraceus]|uniref:uncharacterized protein LOC127093902 n=1 Tax=Pisum sativum TaxID=3888 RepID=UPI0021CF3C13|nr:uncharacterized protein LOC127093902 [Pisum sativum]
MFLRVALVTGVVRALKSRNLTLHFIGPYQTMKRVGDMAYRVALPLFLLNFHDVFHVSQLKKYILDPSHVNQVDDVQAREKLTIEASPLRVEDREVKYLKGKEIVLVKVVWEWPVVDSMAWEMESQMRESYPTLFHSEQSYVLWILNGIKLPTEYVAMDEGEEEEDECGLEERKKKKFKLQNQFIFGFSH